MNTSTHCTGHCTEGPQNTVFGPHEAELGVRGLFKAFTALESHSLQGTGRICVKAREGASGSFSLQGMILPTEMRTTPNASSEPGTVTQLCAFYPQDTLILCY